MSEMNGYYAETPSLATRLWRALGYGWSGPPDVDEDIEVEFPEYIRTDITIYISWPDRLRVLLSGRAVLRVETRTRVRVDHARSFSSFSVAPPGRAAE